MELKGKQKFSYGIGAVGKDMVYMLSASYILYYYQDILGVKAFIMGIILMAARIFDAFNDPIMGVLVAKTKTKWGKFRPWLLIGTILNAIVLFFMFTNAANLVLLLVPAFFIFAANGMLTVLTTVFLANTVDYGELKNNRRDESVIFSMQTFVVKLASGVAVLIVSICLTIFKLGDAAEGDTAIKASAASLLGLRSTMTVIPIVGLLIAVIYFKKKFILTEEKVDEIAKQLAKND